MKNIQIIDGPDNAPNNILQATDKEFRSIFPGKGQDLEIAEDFVKRVGEEAALSVLNELWKRPVSKPEIHGLHGTLFYDYAA